MEIFSKANEELVSGISDQLYGYADVYYASRKQIFLRQVRSIVEKYIVQKLFYKRKTSTETLMALFSVIAQMLILLLTGLLIILEILLLEPLPQ